jgi:cell division protein FtsN
MAAKFGLVLIVIACAVLAFLAGAAAPPSVGQSMANAVAAARQRLMPASSAAAPVPSASSPAAGPAANAGGTATASVAAGSATSVPMASILLPASPPATGTYALQAGQFASQQAAQQLAASISGQGVSSTVVLTTDDTGTSWAVVALGNFTSPAEALSQRTDLANKLGLPQYLAPIVLPPPKPPS